MNLLDHSVLEVPSGGFSWVVEKGLRVVLISNLADWSEFLNIVSITMSVPLTSAHRRLRG
jgi:hypothetical protein